METFLENFWEFSTESPSQVISESSVRLTYQNINVDNSFVRMYGRS
jgi:hypothetical protein